MLFQPNLYPKVPPSNIVALAPNYREIGSTAYTNTTNRRTKYGIAQKNEGKQKEKTKSRKFTKSLN